MNREDIAELIPHKGPMCLLDTLVDWSAQRIHCRSTTHRDTHHPLAVDGYLDASALIEYAAQAVALHGGLLARQDRARNNARMNADSLSSPGRLVALKNIQLAAADCDIPAVSVLDIHAEQALHGAAGMIYAFHVLDGSALLASGQLTIRLGQVAHAADSPAPE